MRRKKERVQEIPSGDMHDVPDENITSPEDAVAGIRLAEQIADVIKTLSNGTEKVLRMRFGIGERTDHTLEEVGEDFVVTRKRIKEIEAKALRKLRHPSRKSLRAFIESK